MLRLVRLQQDFGRPARTTGATRHLGDQLSHALECAEIGAEERLVGVDHADQRQAGEVVALGQHLGADQNLHGAALDVVEQALELAGFAQSVGVEPLDAALRELLTQHFFDALGALPQRSQLFRGAAGAHRWRCGAVTAVMADQAPSIAMQRHARIAVAAGLRPAAVPADHGRRVTAPVDEQQCLASRFDMPLDRLEQRQ